MNLKRKSVSPRTWEKQDSIFVFARISKDMNLKRKSVSPRTWEKQDSIFVFARLDEELSGSFSCTDHETKKRLSQNRWFYRSAPTT